MLDNKVKNAVVGGLTLLGLGAAFALSYGGQHLSRQANVGTYPIHATFARVDGLFEGDDVRMGGILIGKVGAQTLDEHYRANVTLNINTGVELPLDTSAAIHTDGLFGAKFVVLEPGGEMDNLAAGGRILYTQSAVVVTELLDLIIAEGKARQATPQGEP